MQCCDASACQICQSHAHSHIFGIRAAANSTACNKEQHVIFVNQSLWLIYNQSVLPDNVLPFLRREFQPVNLTVTDLDRFNLLPCKVRLRPFHVLKDFLRQIRR